ncbi:MULTISPECIES: sigma-70 family RNA polymerase sigma factor [unclassified Aeromicrobium]|uniref:sigma-70 family RNA polymerase sigma factor n=1 Tax=unclassified Aeromicrobium TaxID=2633570 RepID=UPI00288A4977|nr:MULTISPECIES: sigma-70 family RNA polymerase sigma factor [unclassified Aeromicrobium]
MSENSCTSVRASTSTLDDAHLLGLARDGHDDAYAELFRRYRPVALRLARRLSSHGDAEDTVSEAFAQVLGQLRRGNGPDHAFRAYVLTSVRHEAGRRGRLRQRVQPTDDLAKIDTAVPFGNGQLDSFERDLVRTAFESLPERWRTVLWYLDVEGLKPHEIAERLDLKPNSVSALVYRARAGLREAYLAQHVAVDTASETEECRRVRPRLASLVRRTAGMREQKRIHAHLETCPACMASYLEIEDVNARVVAPTGTTGVADGLSTVAGATAGIVTAAAVVAAARA